MTKLFQRLKDLFAIVLFTSASRAFAALTLGLRLDLNLFLAPRVIENCDFQFFRHKENGEQLTSDNYSASAAGWTTACNRFSFWVPLFCSLSPVTCNLASGTNLPRAT